MERGIQGGLGAGILSSSRAVSASDKVVIGVMGVGGRGTFLAKLFASRPDVEVAYVCDVDSNKLESVAKSVEELGGRGRNLSVILDACLMIFTWMPSSTLPPTIGTGWAPYWPAKPGRTFTSKSLLRTTSGRAERW